jgi:photosystem II stability/assembly factor-like uncharacterized protein
MARVAALLAVVSVLAGTAPAADGPTARRQLSFARLESTSFGIAAIYDVAKCGRGCTSYKPHLFLTSDGRSWREVTPPRMPVQFEDALFLDPAHGWVVSNDCAAGRAFVYRTTDGGRSWRSAAVRSTNCAAGSRLDPTFSDRKHGWILDVYANGNPPYPFSRTLDGGATWREIGRGAPVAGAISAGASGEVWLARSDFAAPQQLYVTRDGGHTWRRRVLPPPVGWSGARLSPDTPTFCGEHGVLPVTLARENRVAVAFYLTSDGGKTWRLRSVRTVEFSRPGLNNPFVRYVPTSIASPTAWWIGGGRTRPSVAVTADAGNTWHVYSRSSLPQAATWNISAADSEHAWLTTSTLDKHALYATGDGGRTWRRLSLPPA